MLKEIVWRTMARGGLDAPYVLWKTGALADYGWFRSFRARRSIDAEGKPVPFMSYPAIEFLARRVQPDISVFEYGSGASTVWWASRVKNVISVEHDETWYRDVLQQIPSNVTLEFVALEPGGAYCRRAVEQGRTFDVVILDGRDRVNCARSAIEALNPRGVIVWDDSERERYAEGQQTLRARGFRKLEFIGIGPIEPVKKETSIFYRPDNCLGI
jgi:predicted O-methyltransferase YrrM